MLYQVLKERESLDAESCQDQASDLRSGEEYRPSKGRRLGWFPIVFSVTLNVVLAYLLTKEKARCKSETKFAGLSYDTSSPIVRSTEFSTENYLESSKQWDALNFDIGVVALDKEYAKSKALHASQSFPWDTSKGIYFINAFHSLHCAKTLHISLLEFQLGKPQTYPFLHVMHCLDALRVEIICNADDTPRYTTTDHDTVSGIDQERKCRDWGKLERWALEHDACYHYFNHSSNNIVDQRQRYLFCQPDSPYTGKVEKYLELLGQDAVVGKMVKR